MTRYLLAVLVLDLIACGSDAADSDVATSDVAADTTGGGDATDVADAATDAADDTSVDASDGDGIGDPSAAFGELRTTWCEGYADRWCAHASTCGCDAAPGFPTSGCKASFVAKCQRGLDAYAPAVASGQAVAHPDAIAGCLASFDDLFDACVLMPDDVFFVACGILTPPGGFEGLPGAGLACAEGGLCAPGLRCAASGLCEVPGAASATCTTTPDCELTLRCNLGVCGAPDFSAAGSACAPTDSCAGETVCAASAVKACVAKVAGGACRFDDDCLATQYCATDVCTDLPGDGVACANGASCAAGLGCDPETTVCGALPGDGAACAGSTGGPILCAAGSTCINGVCGPIPGEGAPCAMGVPACGPGLGCAFEREGSFCRVPGPEGTPCENDPTCAAGLFCDFSENLCRPARARGAPCSAGNECGDGVCLPDATFTFRCADRPGEGDACFIDECGAGLACKSPYSEGACVRGFCAALDF